METSAHLSIKSNRLFFMEENTILLCSHICNAPWNFQRSAALILGFRPVTFPRFRSTRGNRSPPTRFSVSGSSLSFISHIIKHVGICSSYLRFSRGYPSTVQNYSRRLQPLPRFLEIRLDSGRFIEMRNRRFCQALTLRSGTLIKKHTPLKSITKRKLSK